MNNIYMTLLNFDSKMKFCEPDENGNLIPDEIVAVRFEKNDTSEDEEDDG